MVHPVFKVGSVHRLELRNPIYKDPAVGCEFDVILVVHPIIECFKLRISGKILKYTPYPVKLVDKSILVSNGCDEPV